MVFEIPSYEEWLQKLETLMKKVQLSDASNYLQKLNYNSDHELHMEIEKKLEAEAISNNLPFIRTVEKGKLVTGYANYTESNSEDFAESIKLYITDNKNMATKFPNRYEILNKLLKRK